MRTLHTYIYLCIFTYLHVFVKFPVALPQVLRESGPQVLALLRCGPLTPEAEHQCSHILIICCCHTEPYQPYQILLLAILPFRTLAYHPYRILVPCSMMSHASAVKTCSVLIKVNLVSIPSLHSSTDGRSMSIRGNKRTSFAIQE